MIGDFKKAFLQVRVGPEKKGCTHISLFEELEYKGGRYFKVYKLPEQNTEDQTFAKQQLGSTEGGAGTMIGLRWDKQRDIVSIAVPSERLESTKKEY